MPATGKWNFSPRCIGEYKVKKGSDLLYLGGLTTPTDFPVKPAQHWHDHELDVPVFAQATVDMTMSSPEN